jgi:Phosphodiester glycosidase/Purple acid Phosphatase, N-terminal domain
MTRTIATAAAVLLGAGAASAATLGLGPWTPIFKGVDVAHGTNNPNITYPDKMVMHVVRVDLTDPDVHLFATPRITSPSYEARVRETSAMTVARFLQTHQLQVAINANFFSTDANFGSPNYYLPEGTPMVVEGQLFSRGVQVAGQRAGDSAAAMIFDASNVARFIPTNWPAAATNGIYTAVTGLYPLVVNGVNIGRAYLGNPDQVHQVNPRTIFGLSQDDKTLFLMTIDGRQGPFSDGSLDYESGAWLLAVGAYNGMNMDGGGSATLVQADSTGAPKLLNYSAAAAPNNSGNLRVVGAHFGVFAKPVPGFFNNVQALPDDASAGIAWSTYQAANASIQYGTTASLGQSGPSAVAFSTNHTALLTGLQPDTQYFYQISGNAPGGILNTSPLYTFTTTNYASTNHVFDVTNSWSFTTANLDGVNWTATNYDDSAWNPGGPGLLWIDVRATPDADVQPKNTQLPAAGNGYPYVTYYFRTHVQFSNPGPGDALTVNAWVDDGAVFYLNGVEAYLLRMNPSPKNSDIAVGYACAGDAVLTCPDVFSFPATAAVNGDNVLAVEVHNFNAFSLDITFGMTLDYSSPTGSPPQLSVGTTNGTPVLNWSRNGFSLQSASTPAGPWTDLPGPVVTGPYSPSSAKGATFYRLHR